MNSICYVVPYFGTLPKTSFRLWLKSCKANPTVNWIIFTDDKTEYDYPDNVKVYYTTLGKDLAEAEAEKEKLADALIPILA